MRKITFLLFLLVSFSFLLAQTYEFDKSFGDNGVVKVPCNGNFCVGFKIHLLDNGSFLLHSVYEDYILEEVGFEITKFDKSGKIDSSFAKNGVFEVNNSYADSPIYHCLLPDNKIAVIANVENDDNISIMILDENGEILKTLNFVLFPEATVFPSKCLFKDGYLYIGGIKFQDEDLFVLKTDLNGKLDSSFAENGVFLFERDTVSVDFIDMEFQNNDLIVYTTFNNANVYSNEDVIFRIKQNGTIDTNFGTMGYFTIKKTDGFGDLSVDSKERIVLTPFYSNAVYRLNENGLPDINFGNTGIVYLAELSILGNYFLHTINSKDEILLFGSISNDEYDAFGIPVILKINENGEKDNTFGSNGILFNNFDKLAVNYAGEIDANGYLITTGSYIENPDDENFNMFITRLKPRSTSENNILARQELNIFPNPVNSDKITVQFPEFRENPVSIKVVDLLGNYIFKAYIPELENNIPELSFNIPDYLKNGMYLIVTNIGKEVYSNKIIIQR